MKRLKPFLRANQGIKVSCELQKSKDQDGSEILFLPFSLLIKVQNFKKFVTVNMLKMRATENEIMLPWLLNQVKWVMLRGTYCYSQDNE